MTDTFRQQH